MHPLSAFQLAAPSLTAAARPRNALVCCRRDQSPTSTRRAFLSGVLRLSGAASMMSIARASALPNDAVKSTTASMSANAKAATSRKVLWGYVDDIGPERWGELTEEWAVCSYGLKQSPIELSYKEARLAAVDEPRPILSTTRSKFALRRKGANDFAANKWLLVEPYVPPPPAVVGDAPPVDVLRPPAAAIITLPDVGRYRLATCHFHTGGSEHVLNGMRARMEAHFVFALDKTVAAPKPDPVSVTDVVADDPPPRGTGSSNVVVGVMIAEGDTTSPWLQTILTNSIKPLNDDLNAGGCLVELDLAEIMPNFNKANLYSYDGSLTTPPGTESIHWVVMGQRSYVTAEDWKILEAFQGGPNTRPLQAGNGREVVQFPKIVPAELPVPDIM